LEALVAPLTRAQIANRDRIESLIGLAAPLLDLVLAAGDRISRIAEPTDDEYYPIRSGGPVPLPGEPGYEDDGGLPAESAPTDERGETAGT
jgi:hypothetical protein